MVSWFKSAMQESEKYIDAMSDCIPEIKDNSKDMTNADRIRNMTDSDLAHFLEDIDKFWNDGECCIRINGCVAVDDYTSILEWLQSEAEGE